MLTPNPPCDQCHGACCTRPGYRTLVALEEDEAPEYQEAVLVKDRCGDHMAIPVRPDGRCIHLAADNRCLIYDRRPRGCRNFNCLHSYGLGRNRHGFFLEDHPDVVQLIELTYPDYAAAKRQEQLNRPEI